MYCKNFSELSNRDAAIAGGKGASLGEMTNAGIPVPPGFVVLADAFEKFLDVTNLNTEIDAILHTVKTDEMRSVEHASERVQKLILESKMPEDIGEEIVADFELLDAEHVAVRSSATAEDSASAAWAGQLDSFLNTTEESLLKNVQRCWASLFTPRAIFYRFEQGLHESKISVAVVVQKMVESEVSGIAFSVHPVTEDFYNAPEPILVAAGWRPGRSTDFCAVLLGRYLDAKRIINLSNIDYAYDKDPREFPDAKKIECTTWAEFRKIVGTEWNPGMSAPFDPIASKMAEEEGMEVAILNGSDLTNLGHYLDGEAFKGTVVRDES